MKKQSNDGLVYSYNLMEAKLPNLFRTAVLIQEAKTYLPVVVADNDSHFYCYRNQILIVIYL